MKLRIKGDFAYVNICGCKFKIRFTAKNLAELVKLANR